MIDSKAYAKALFELAVENDCLETLSLDFFSVIEIFESNPDFLSLLSLPSLETSEKLGILKKVFQCTEDILFNFLCLITENGKIIYISEIGSEFKKFYNQHNNIEEVTVVSCISLTDDERNRLIVRLQNKLKKRINLTEIVDSSIIGGIRLSYGSTMIDNSISSRIESLLRQLKNND